MKEVKKEALSPRGNAGKGQEVTLQGHSSIGAGQCQGARPLALCEITPEHNPRYACTDIGNGRLFADWAKTLARYVPERKLWYIFNGKVWEPDTGNLRAMELCKKLADELVIYAVGLPEGLERDKYRKSVERWQVRRNREIILKDAAGVYPIKLNEFDNNPWLFNCQNGTLDLRTRAFKQHDPADLLATISGVEYDPNAHSTLWEQTISDVTQGDLDLSAYLQKALGYGLTGDTSEECFFLLYGPTTRNGKGTVMETYMKLLGGYGKAARPETIALRQHTNSSGPTEDIAKLAGARAVNISEPDKQMVLSAALVKTLTGNDTMTARFLNENSFEFKPQFKLFINTNHLPKVFSGAKLKYIVLDEAHIYKGATGMETSLLMRRLRARISQPGSVQYILTSATLGGPDADHEIVNFAEKLCGVTFRASGIVRSREKQPSMAETRDFPRELFVELNQAPQNTKKILEQYQADFAPDGTKEEKLYALFLRAAYFSTLRKAAAEPVTVAQLRKKLSEIHPITNEQVVALIAVCARAEKDGAGLIKPRYHFFVRALEGAFVTLAEPKRLFLQRKLRWKETDNKVAVFEAAVCEDCGQIAVVGREDMGI